VLWHLNCNIHPCIIIKNKFNTKERGAPKSAGSIAIATIAAIVNPTLDKLNAWLFTACKHGQYKFSFRKQYNYFANSWKCFLNAIVRNCWITGTLYRSRNSVFLYNFVVCFINIWQCAPFFAMLSHTTTYSTCVCKKVKSKVVEDHLLYAFMRTLCLFWVLYASFEYFMPPLSLSNKIRSLSCTPFTATKTVSGCRQHWVVVVVVCLEQLCPTEIAYRTKNYVNILTRAAHWMTYFDLSKLNLV